MPKIDPFKLPDGRPISNAIEQWGELSDRDFAVAGCAVLDANLTHLLQKRLADLPKIAEGFFGLGDNIKDAGALALASKAELAALVGLITPEYVRYLKAFMRIRNHFAHRVVMDFMTDCVVKELNKLTGLVEQTTKDEWKNDPNPNVQQLYQMSMGETRKIGKTNQSGRAVFSWSRVALEIHFWWIDLSNERVKTLKFFPPPSYEI